MKKLFFVLIVVVMGLIGLPVNAASTDNFYFSDFTGDYYLVRDELGVSHLKVIESVTAVFPNYNQNKGICRQIPFTNQGGNNIVLSNLTKSDITLTRNGLSEPIYSIKKENGYYSVCTGNDNYVLGEQTYVFKYQFDNVVTEFTQNGRVFQELYWDTNGNGSLQRFDKVTARVHFEDVDVWTGESWCYVGVFGANEKGRCEITKTSDGVSFVSENLGQFENMTFDVELRAGSFVIPEQEKNYTYVWLIVVLGAICMLVIGCVLRKYLAVHTKILHYKNTFIKPEFQPAKDYSLPEMAGVYIGKKKSIGVAMLLDLVVNHKIIFQKKDGDKKSRDKKWNILVKNLGGVGEEYIDLLAILNNGVRPTENDVIDVKNQTASNKLISLNKSLERKVTEDLKKDGLVEATYSFKKVSKGGIGDIITTIIFVSFGSVMAGLALVSSVLDLLGLSGVHGDWLVFEPYFLVVAVLMIVATVIISVCLCKVAKKYSEFTMKGLEMSRYMDGLKLYIKMAEADRFKMLQSVEGVDTSAEGIVKLYEKLLPYAAVFGLEESWINEMKEYCEVKEIEEPDYLMGGLAASEITRSLRDVANVAAASSAITSTMIGSGGGSSSGFSGGGGGGFSGGGGGGGGFSGR